jgi:hypothetical protein
MVAIIALLIKRMNENNRRSLAVSVMLVNHQLILYGGGLVNSSFRFFAESFAESIPRDRRVRNNWLFGWQHAMLS